MRHSIQRKDPGNEMHIVIAGSSGFIGSALIELLLRDGHRVTRLVRSKPTDAPAAPEHSLWDPYRELIDLEIIEQADAIINLSGESVASRWTAKKKKAVLESRIKSTALLTRAVSSAQTPPRIFISASAIGYYGKGGETWFDESSDRGEGFLADVCAEWEAAAMEVNNSVTRGVLPRFGVVLSKKGGALKKMLPVFRLGLGGRLGSGEQYLSWVSLEDALKVLTFSLQQDIVTGPLNVCAPAPVTNKEFTKALGTALRKPVKLPVPAPILHLAFGQMADETLLSSARVRPSKLLSSGFQFQDPELYKFLQEECA